jgi:glycosyltransferase involved in cell wall biosynthesis
MDEVKRPFVSIVIPYYNKKDTIKRSIQSVLNQTYTNWELIIVDDKGQEPLEWEENWNLLRIKLLINPENLGAAQSRQRGQDIAHGEYIAFLDADDWWGDRFLEKCLEKLEQFAEVAGCYVNIIEVENGKENKRNSYSGQSNILNTVIAYRRPWQTSGILWRKEILGNWGNLKTHEDSWFEVMTSKNNNLLKYVQDENCYYDNEGTNHLSFLNGRTNSTIDQQKLFLMIYKEFWQILDFKHKVILFHRLIRGQLKIHEYCPEYSVEMGELLMKLNPRLFWRRNQPFILKIIHKILQNSPFKINF